MRALDRAAIETLGIPGAVLMERAGLGAAHEIIQRFGDAGPVVVVAGGGNNGGDGFVVARHLLAAGLDARVPFFGAYNRHVEDARCVSAGALRAGGTYSQAHY